MPWFRCVQWITGQTHVKHLPAPNKFACSKQIDTHAPGCLQLVPKQANACRRLTPRQPAHPKHPIELRPRHQRAAAQ